MIVLLTENFFRVFWELILSLFLGGHCKSTVTSFTLLLEPWRARHRTTKWDVRTVRPTTRPDLQPIASAPATQTRRTGRDRWLDREQRASVPGPPAPAAVVVLGGRDAHVPTHGDLGPDAHDGGVVAHARPGPAGRGHMPNLHTQTAENDSVRFGRNSVRTIIVVLSRSHDPS